MCAVACAQKAIALKRNEDGFYAPAVDMELCSECGICMKVCYQYLERKTTYQNTFENKPVYAAWSTNSDTVMSSSSGGIGYELTSYYFEKGYNICGCVFDAPDDCCKHIIACTPDDLDAIRTSKYLQSYTVDAFSQFRKDEKYLVIGTPCQIYGLRKWIQLKKWEDNFILVDFFCHGTPTFNLWKKYKEYVCKKYNMDFKWKSVNFRGKNLKSGWHKNTVSIRDFLGRKFEKGYAFAEDLFFTFFLNNSCLNEACYQCNLRLDNCVSDIRIADFWGRKYSSNDAGVSLVVVNTANGKRIFDKMKYKLTVENCDFKDLTDSQRMRFLSEHGKRDIILAELKGGKTLNGILIRHLFSDFVKNKMSKPKRKVKQILGENTVKALKKTLNILR
jgi:coenzyme F420-reducing hydrogenase beta subunit